MVRYTIAAAAVAALLLAACSSNPVYYRLGSDYYPVSPAGTQWEYDVEGGGTVVVTVVDQAEVAERACYRIQRGADYAYYINDAGMLEHYEDHSVLYNGYEIEVYTGWVPYLDWPLTEGASWTDSISVSTSQQGVTINHQWTRTTTVLGVETVTVPAGTWTDCYHLRETETEINWIQTGGFQPETTSVNRHIWLAPDVGMVRKTTADSTMTLSSFTPGE
jgi:outer membrane murein-binding lipoprotein Lpp